MDKTALNPILVTGTHRSGTTWVGKMLAADGMTAYISEPLNVLHRPGVFHTKVECWYQYICEENERQFLPAFQELLEFDYNLWDEIRSLRSRRDFLRMGRDFYIFYNGLMRGQRVLLKDPFAVFSTPWFAKRLNCKVVITVRHPAAFASSLQRLNWPFDFQDLLKQPLLMRDHLEPDRQEMQSMQADDVIGQAALLWKLIYRSVHATRERNPDFIVVRHEDLSRDPIPGYRDLYQALGLEFTPRVKKIILNSSSSENPKELAREKVHGFRLDSRANIGNWKKRLTAEDIDRVREITKEIAPLYYSGAEW
ncbi:MAG TPA: sulfotransferase domain-containing protein [Anaerolineales bacterium]|nr:sulfotransferase domain-containing protein [Anaerolineales bacterium]